MTSVLCMCRELVTRTCRWGCESQRTCALALHSLSQLPRRQLHVHDSFMAYTVKHVVTSVDTSTFCLSPKIQPVMRLVPRPTGPVSRPL